MLAHSIAAARAAQRVGGVYVSTDAPEIAAVARAWGAEVIWRPAELATDSASSESALLHALDEIDRSGEPPADLLAFIQCTSPLTRPEHIDGAIQKLVDESAESCVAVTPFHYFLWRDAPDGALGLNHDKSVRQRRQAREPQYLEAGSIYVMQVAGFRRAKHRFFGKTALYPVPAEYVQEIDDPVDFAVSQVKLEFARQEERAARLPANVRVVALDFDGVLTDNAVYVDENGIESVRCHRGDGFGLERLKRAGFELLILSKEQNPVVRARAGKLGLPVIHGVEDKRQVLGSWLAARKVSWADTVYVGNDLNDVECLLAAGCGVAVADAHPSARAAADMLLEAAGGCGAVRELCDLILDSKGSNHGK